MTFSYLKNDLPKVRHMVQEIKSFPACWVWSQTLHMVSWAYNPWVKSSKNKLWAPPAKAPKWSSIFFLVYQLMEGHREKLSARCYAKEANLKGLHTA